MDELSIDLRQPVEFVIEAAKDIGLFFDAGDMSLSLADCTRLTRHFNESPLRGPAVSGLGDSAVPVINYTDEVELQPGMMMRRLIQPGLPIETIESGLDTRFPAAGTVVSCDDCDYEVDYHEMHVGQSMYLVRYWMSVPDVSGGVIEDDSSDVVEADDQDLSDFRARFNSAVLRLQEAEGAILHREWNHLLSLYEVGAYRQIIETCGFMAECMCRDFLSYRAEQYKFYKKIKFWDLLDKFEGVITENMTKKWWKLLDDLRCLRGAYGHPIVGERRQTPLDRPLPPPGSLDQRYAGVVIEVARKAIDMFVDGVPVEHWKSCCNGKDLQ